MALADQRDDRAAADPITHVNAGPVSMVFILAFVEAVCYLGLFHTLTGYISGATVLLATEIFHPEGEVITKTLVLVAFVPATFVWVILKEHGSGWRYFVPMLFVIEACLLTLYMVIAISMSPLRGADAAETMLIVVISVLALSLHNVHSQQVMPEKAPIAITVLFGNFASSMTHLCALMRTGKSTGEAAAAFKKLLYPLVAFIGGAFLGAFGFTWLGFLALAGPIVILIAMAAFSLTNKTPVVQS